MADPDPKPNFSENSKELSKKIEEVLNNYFVEQPEKDNTFLNVENFTMKNNKGIVLSGKIDNFDFEGKDVFAYKIATQNEKGEYQGHQEFLRFIDDKPDCSPEELKKRLTELDIISK